ncbi:hypothetical protein JAAARDRAFT_107844, partial [Jaapia argillacea MUCL 33604]
GVPNFDALQSSKKVLLYERRPAWWVRWTYALVVADILSFGSMAHFGYNYWTKYEDESQASVPISDAPNPVDSSPPKGRWVARPEWQRFFLASSQVVVGTFIAGALLIYRSHVVTKIHIFQPLRGPSTRSTQQVLVQNPQHRAESGGRLYNMQDCQLRPGRDTTEMILRVKGVKGHFWIGTKGALIKGKDLGVQ